MLNNRDPKIDLILHSPLYYMMIEFLFFVSDSEDNLESFSKKEKIIRRHVVSLLVNHDKYSQMPSISQ